MMLTDSEARDKLRQISEVLYTTLATQQHSFEIAKAAPAGDIVECGIAAGGNFASMVVGALTTGVARKFWGFDSFQGIQLAGRRDNMQPALGPIKHDVNVPEESLLVSSGVTVHSRESVIELLTRWELWGAADIELIAGWVQHTLPVHAHRIERIAVLRLDMDLYSPTKCALEWLGPKVIPGGTIIIDDWILDRDKPDVIDGARSAFIEYTDATGQDWRTMKQPRYVGEEHQAYFVRVA